MCEQDDLILVMEPCQIDMVADIHPPARSKTHAVCPMVAEENRT